jgi:hypothetical protein
MKRVRRNNAAPRSEKDTWEARNVEEALASHMVAEALLAAHFVAAAERAGMDADAINAVLRDIVSKSGIDEFWITDNKGHAYLTSTDIDFTFSPSAALQPQAAVFWPLIDGATSMIIQEAREREIDHEVFKYVAVAGVDQPRIVQVGINARILRC